MPVLSWQDALDYMQNHPKFRKDLTVLLPQGLEPEVRQAYWPRIVDEVHGSVEVAQAHHFMGGVCPICSARGSDHCEQANDLGHRFQRLAIPRGTQYLALTEGKDGRVTFNRVFLGDAIAYRVNVLGGRAFIDLIARCRNTALGQRPEYETYTAFTPPAALPAAPTLLPVTPAPQEVVAGSRTVFPSVAAASPPVLPPIAYIGPGQPQFIPRGYQAGSLSLWFRPDVRVRINQTAPAAAGAAGGSNGTAVGAGSGSAQPTPVQPTLVVGPGTLQPPVAAAGGGNQVQGPSPAASGNQVQRPTPVIPQVQPAAPVIPAGSPQLNLPAQRPVQGAGGQTQGQAPR
jgi:hypothetical protein